MSPAVLRGPLRGSLLASARGEERESRVSNIFLAVEEERGREEVGGAEGCGLAVTVICTGASCRPGERERGE